MMFLLDSIATSDILIVCVVLLLLAVAGIVTYGAAREKRRKMQKFTDIFQMGDDNFTPEEIRMAVERDRQAEEEKASRKGEEPEDGKDQQGKKP